MAPVFDPRRYGQPVRPRQDLTGVPNRLISIIDHSDSTSNQESSQIQASNSNQATSHPQTSKQAQPQMSDGSGNGIKIPGFDGSRYGKPLVSPASQKQDEKSANAQVDMPIALRRNSVRGPSLSFSSDGKDKIKSLTVGFQTQHLASSGLTDQTSVCGASPPSSSQTDSKVKPSRVDQALTSPPPPQQQDGRKSAKTPVQQSLQAQERVKQKASFGTNGFGVLRQTPERKPQATTIEKGQETPEEVLKRIQAQEMQKIGYRNRGKDSTSTTSLRDLELARRPLPANAGLVLRSELTVARESQHSDETDKIAGGIASAKPISSHEIESSSGPDKEQQNPQFSSAMASSPNWDERDAQDLRHHHPNALSPVENTSDTVPHESKSQKSRKSRWCTPAELKPVPANIDTESNACGSDVASDEATESKDSMNAMHHGKLFRGKQSGRPEYSLVGWDGKMQPAPVDWHDRPHFNNNTPTFKNSFNNWANASVERFASNDSNHPFNIIPTEVVRDLNVHPDGLGMVPRDFVVDFYTAEKYGYGGELADTTKDSQPFETVDWQQWERLDLTLPENRRVAEETTDSLVTNWLAQQELRRRQAGKPAQITARQLLESYRSCGPNPNRPRVNIYLRPVVKADLPQITQLYNWHVDHGPRTAEFKVIKLRDMIYRFEGSVQQKLPFIVAVLKAKNRAPGQRGNETVVGFACAQDFTAPDFVERIAAEVELYVHQAWQGQGVGRCLLDKLLDATDRGHLKKGGYDFHCASEVTHMYTAGGGRDLHMLVFVLRHWKSPKTLAGKGRNGRVMQNGEVEAEVGAEDDYARWIKPWLEKWDFEEQGCLKGVGAKNGRFLNVGYLCKETKWQPCEGSIPEYFAPQSAS